MEILGVMFDEHQFPARKDLIDFVVEKVDRKALEKIGQDPDRWIEELEILYEMFSRGGLGSFQDFSGPPKDKHLLQIGSNAYRYLGPNTRYRGFYVTSKLSLWNHRSDQMVPATAWTRYKLGSNAKLLINHRLAHLPPSTFLPENFEPISTQVKNDRRPIYTFGIHGEEEGEIVFAKGSSLSLSLLTQPPSYRLTSLAGVRRFGYETEMRTTLRLAQAGVRVPKVLGLYSSLFEEFLFLQKIDGGDPRESLDKHKPTIIEQDAQMLAALCLLGLRKIGFTDFDDKVFDGRYLYLIDVDEIQDLYFPARPDFRQMLTDPNETSELEEFRQLQKDIFTTFLRDALFKYRGNLLATPADQAAYIGTYYQRIGWGEPSRETIKRLSTFEEGYMTHDRYMAMMMEN